MTHLDGEYLLPCPTWKVFCFKAGGWKTLTDILSHPLSSGFSIQNAHIHPPTKEETCNSSDLNRAVLKPEVPQKHRGFQMNTHWFQFRGCWVRSTHTHTKKISWYNKGGKRRRKYFHKAPRWLWDSPQVKKCWPQRSHKGRSYRHSLGFVKSCHRIYTFGFIFPPKYLYSFIKHHCSPLPIHQTYKAMDRRAIYWQRSILLLPFYLRKHF